MPNNEKLTRRRQRRTERLRLALEKRGWSKWRFQKELVAQGIPGTSRANIDRYLKGEVDKPPVDFYVEAARLLGVTLLWLLGETDAVTEEELAAEEAERQTAMHDYWEGFDRELSVGFPGYEYVSEYTRGGVRSAWAAYDSYLSMQPDPPQHPYAGVRETGAAILAPLRELGIETIELTRWQLDRYVIGVCQAFAFLNLKYASLYPRLL